VFCPTFENSKTSATFLLSLTTRKDIKPPQSQPQKKDKHVDELSIYTAQPPKHGHDKHPTSSRNTKTFFDPPDDTLTFPVDLLSLFLSTEKSLKQHL
jgi:hypothetical protein